ncbi:MAG: hypothetical protein AAGE94_02400 [Acidobacteriota bacterium]
MTSDASPTHRPSEGRAVGPVQILGLFLVLALAAWIRLEGLDTLDTRGDEVELVLMIQDGKQPLPYLAEHFRDFGYTRQLPLPRVLTTAIVQWSSLEASATSVRLPFVWAGALTALAMFWLGVELSSVRLGWVLALLAATNPFSVYWSKTAHIYAFPLLFVAATLAATVRLAKTVDAHGRAGWRSVAVATVCSIAACASHMTAWPAVALCWLLPVGVWLRGMDRSAWRAALERRESWILLAGPIVCAVFVAPWAWKFVGALLAQRFDPVWSEPQTTGLYSLRSMWRLPFTYGFGSGWRGVLSLGLPLAAFLLPPARPLRRQHILVLGAATAALFVAISSASASGFFALRYYSALWPLWLALTGCGLLAVVDACAERRAPAWTIWTVAAILLGTTLTPPLRALVSLRGNPVEYSRIAETLDEHLAEGAPALVNGMNVVRIEMRSYMPEKAVPTYTVPDVGLAMWRGNDWRGSAERFLTRFSDAALVQQGKNYYDHPEIGPWEWADRHFSQTITLRNEPALLLQRLDLGASEDFYTDRCVTTIRFNRPEDLLDRARQAGEPVVVLWGDGWQYGKSLNLQDWRVLEERATLHLHNLTDSFRRVRLELRAATGNGLKRITIGERETWDVEAGELQSRQIAWVARPGLNVIELTDELWSIGRIQLLVSQVEVDTGG